MGCGIFQVNKDALVEKIKRGNKMKSFNFDNMNLSCLKMLDNFAETQNITVFSANKNNLNQIPAYFFSNIVSIIKIDLSFNTFQNIDDVIFKKHSLQILNYSNNYIENISPKLKNLENLKELDLSNNHISKFPPESICGLKSLEILNISHNIFNEFPIIIITLPKLETLNISNNKVKEISNDENWKDSKFKNLDISYNQLSEVASKLLKNSNISKFNLKGNCITISQLTSSEGYLEFEKRRKIRKEQGYQKNLDITFSLCGLDS